ncbi:uncharacterized protein N7482_007029 [Penicillium canariense]|uniref:GPI-anchored cell surface glycoprotein n=1 Tax=Penicillium canariense TaxID=189055 RepID=A0A9W9LJH4_9EURO|nr:uncharacterized protein N7482_007029 [Penicillium canariense]KAJ5160025.1 hypothetical protein N7482_007029 [Penicillium canariense]
MSLNGLDTPAVVEAYQSALADAGGWILLHYTARDEVALLDRGTGGVPEVRNAIDNYAETSPLYGFLHYRRRKVVLRYMPEGLSRLIQGRFLTGVGQYASKDHATDLGSSFPARSNVQFQSVLDKFTPNDTVLPLSQASELNESALSSACLLHTASGSITSSSSSLRRRRLMEITEDAEESGVKEETTKQSEPQPPPKAETRRRSGSQKSEATVVPPSATSPEVEKSSPEPQPPLSAANSRAPPSRESPSESHASTTSASSPRSPDSDLKNGKYRNILDEFPRPSEEVRMSTQSARPSLRELERAAGYTPKVKLGPRPSVDQSGRPRTSGSSRNPDQRPVASLPAGMRSSSLRKPPSVTDVPRPRSQGSSFATKPNSRAPPIPPLLIPPPSIPISRPQLSPGAKSLGALSTSSGLTPEKERLMKALQQRKKQMAKRAEQTKRKQAIPEAEKEVNTLQESAQSEKENKENINLACEPERRPKIEAETTPEPKTQLEPEKPQETQDDEKAATPAMAIPEPSDDAPKQPQQNTPVEPTEDQVPLSSETLEPESLQNKDTVEPEEEQTRSSPAASNAEPEPTADATTVSDSEGPSSHTSGASADTTFSTDRAETPVEAIKSGTAQTGLEEEVPEVETRAEHTDSAVLAPNETKDDLAPPSANAEVPLDKEATGVPDTTLEPENASPLQEPEVLSVVDKQLEEPTTEETAPAAIPETVTIPILPPVDCPPSPIAEPAVPPVLVSIEAVPQDETAPEESHARSITPIVPPLDQRRKIHLEPIQVPTLEYSDDDNLLSDDSFMEELRSATVLQARPVSVKTPNGGDQSWKGSRAVSSPYGLASPSVMHALAVGRSVSSSYPDNGPPTPVLMAKKINVSSGISSRIKALEKFSSREGAPPNPNTVTGPSASSSFESLRKRASVSIPNGTLPDFSRAPSVKHHDAGPVSTATRRTNSISVTARIVRDNGVSPESSGLEPSESDVLNLQASPLTVEQHEATNEPLSNSSTFESITHRSEARSMSTSSAGSNRQATPVSRPGSRPSLSSRPKTDENLQASSPTDEKKGSRTSRLMRRMSSITSTSRRSIIGALSPPVKEEVAAVSSLHDSAISPSSSRQTLTDPIDIGEVNVQFPETLLWKRRFMRINENGYVVLTPATNDASARNMTKRYHLTEFRTPCLPDEDMQELPNSILLEFLDGSTLQCACESRQGQSWTLQTLVHAYNAYRP